MISLKEVKGQTFKKVKINSETIHKIKTTNEFNGFDKYEGDYQITPLAYKKQQLKTKNKVLKDNLIINEVPIFEVSNLMEGTTVYIASEV